MALSDEEWAKLSDEIKSAAPSLMSPDERKALLEAHAPELYLKAQKRSVRAFQCSLNKHPAYSLEYEESEDFYSRPPSGRALEDLVLECVAAGIKLEDYL